MKPFYLETNFRSHLHTFQEVFIFYMFRHYTVDNVCVICVQLVDHTQDDMYSSSKSI